MSSAPAACSLLWLAAPFLLAAAARGASPVRDPHSAARPEETRVEHLALDLTVDFASRTLRGHAALTLALPHAATLWLDTRDLDIASVALDGGRAATFALQPEVKLLGRALRVDVLPDTRTVTLAYSTRPEAAALQWLTPAQTAGGKSPFLFSQSEPILARTWVPCQDTPSVRQTYEATLHVPRDLLAVMSAENPRERSTDGVYHFRMEQPVPSYLLALAVGDLAFRPLGPRTGVYAEPAVLKKAAWELADTEKMVSAAEGLFGPYRWGRYDLLVLPPSFPFGGMENPRLTFATPTILAGDRSLVSLVAHELAHSWSGNLVTNATWNDFWLNEGFTNYFESRIVAVVSGRPFSEMQAALQLQSLRKTIAELGAQSPDTRLHLDLAGRDPDEGVSDIAYEKGFFFVRLLEEQVGRARFDAFLRGYFDTFAFQAMDSERFLAYLDEHLLNRDPALAQRVDARAWVDGPGLPANCPQPRSTELDAIAGTVARFAGGTPAKDLATNGWTAQHWLNFLNNLPASLTAARMAELDDAFHFTASGNSEIEFAWFRLAIAHGYAPADAALERYLLSIGRRKLVVPLYKELAKTPAGLARAKSIYERARPGYHSVTTGTLDPLLRGAAL
jgi:aminopeptidase N